MRQLFVDIEKSQHYSLALATAALAGPIAAQAPSLHDPALAAAVSQWFTHGGDARISALQKDFETIARSADGTDLPGVEAGCTALVVDVGHAQHYDPLPDGQAQQHWSTALSMYANGAADRVKGAGTVDSDRLLRANDEILRGTAELTQATERIQAILD